MRPLRRAGILLRIVLPSQIGTNAERCRRRMRIVLLASERHVSGSAPFPRGVYLSDVQESAPSCSAEPRRVGRTYVIWTDARSTALLGYSSFIPLSVSMRTLETAQFRNHLWLEGMTYQGAHEELVREIRSS